jgi:hypothetical protein
MTILDLGIVGVRLATVDLIADAQPFIGPRYLWSFSLERQDPLVDWAIRSHLRLFRLAIDGVQCVGLIDGVWTACCDDWVECELCFTIYRSQPKITMLNEKYEFYDLPLYDWIDQEGSVTC